MKGINFAVSPHCTLLFFRKENIKSDELALVAVHGNCFIGCIMTTRGYRLQNADHTTMDIYLFVGNGN